MDMTIPTDATTPDRYGLPRGWDNSTLAMCRRITDDLAILRIRPDGPLFDFQAGQYAVIGLPVAAPRCQGSDPDDPQIGKPDKLIRRAYSIASSSKVNEYVELYVTLVRSGALTPRLWLLGPENRLWLGTKAKGVFTMDDVPLDKNVVLIGTGTGLAPYISMIREHHQCNRGRRFIVVHGARYAADLGYRDELESIDRECRTMAYVPTVSRPDPDWPGHVGYVQSVLSDGSLESALGEPLSADTAHVFVSGNPEMVEEMQALLLEAGFTPHAKRAPGSLHIEKYW